MFLQIRMLTWEKNVLKKTGNKIKFCRTPPRDAGKQKKKYIIYQWLLAFTYYLRFFGFTICQILLLFSEINLASEFIFNSLSSTFPWWHVCFIVVNSKMIHLLNEGMKLSKLKRNKIKLHCHQEIINISCFQVCLHV